MGRKDARLMTELDNFSKFYTYLMPSRAKAACWILQQVDASGIIAFLDEKMKEGKEYTVFQLVVAALIRTAAKYPELNRFIYGHKIYARKEYTISYGLSVGEKTTFRKVSLEPENTIADVSAKIAQQVSEARNNPDFDLDTSIDVMMKIPGFLTSIFLKMYPWLVDKGIFPKKVTDSDVLYSSAMVSNLGTFGIGAPLHHLYEWGNASLFVTVGLMRKTPVALADGTLKAMDMIDIGFTIDERICNGKKLTDALGYFKECIENPWVLEMPPEKVIRE